MTAPYMHDGSVATSEEAIDHYAAGGRTMARTGVGRDNPNKSTTLRGFVRTNDERADLVAFLESLTDDAVLRDARYADPLRSTTPSADAPVSGAPGQLQSTIRRQ